MPQFAHISDVHLGGWKQKPMQDLNFESFRMALDICIKRKVEFVLIAGDLFDTAYPPIEVLKETFAEFRKLKQAGIPCFIIAGSHDYSVSGKTFLDVLEKAGFCTNVTSFYTEGKTEERDDKILLNPYIYKNTAIYGYPGKKSGLEIPDLRRLKLNDAPGLFRILMMHTTMDKAKGTLPIDSLECDKVPKVDYYALGHLHIDWIYENFVYPGPVFPNNFQELRDLENGSFYIIKTDSPNMFEKINLKIKDIEYVDVRVSNSSIATEQILLELAKRNLYDKIILLKVRGELESGKVSDINFSQIEDYLKNKGAYFLLKNTHDLKTKEVELEIISDSVKEENIEEETVKAYAVQNPSDFNSLIPLLMNSLSTEKQEGETTNVFESRLLEDLKKILRF